VRPFGAEAENNGKPYLSMNNTKKVFKQLQQNSKCEICGMLSPTKWFRITGTLAQDDSNASRAEFLKQCPLPMYKADDGIFEIMYFTSVSGTVESFDGPKEEF
jgi:uncharacterized pyridoxamine 5'-phosphate oxidase family protein